MALRPDVSLDLSSARRRSQDGRRSDPSYFPHVGVIEKYGLHSAAEGTLARCPTVIAGAGGPSKDATDIRRDIDRELYFVVSSSCCGASASGSTVPGFDVFKLTTPPRLTLIFGAFLGGVTPSA